MPGGLVVLVTPFSWLAQYTPREKWLGGAARAGGEPPRRSEEGLAAAMAAAGFALRHREDCPFLIREHARKFQLGVSLLTVWQLTA